MKKRSLIPCMIALAVALGACSKPPAENHEAKAERIPQVPVLPASPQTAPASDETVQAVSPESKIQLPEGFAKDVPVFPGAVIKSFSRAPQNRSQQVQYVAKAALDEVAKFYADAAQQSGWSLRDESGDAQTKRFRLDKEARRIEVMLAPSETGTTCTLMLAQP